MIWKDELLAIDELSKRVANFGSDISRQLTHLESRRDTLTNEIARLDADYVVLKARNEDSKKEFQKAMRLDVEQLSEGKRRVQEREVHLIEKEKELQKLRTELETQIASAKTTKNTMEALGRNHVRK